MSNELGLAFLKREGAFVDSLTGRELSPDEVAKEKARLANQLRLKQQFEAAETNPPEVLNPDWLQAQVMMLGQFHSQRDRHDAMEHLRGLVLRRTADGRVSEAVTCANLVAPQTEERFSWGW